MPSPLASGLVAAVMAVALAGQREPSTRTVDVLRYDLHVTIGEGNLEIVTSIQAKGDPPAEWTLELAPEMQVTRATCADRPVPFTRDGYKLVLDGSAIAARPDGTFTLALAATGSPLEEQRSRGFVRSAVRPDVVYIRSQYPWYPRISDELAVAHTVVDAESGWHVRTAGDFAPPKVTGDRATWTFTNDTRVDRLGLVAGPWLLRASGDLDALVSPEHAEAADAMLALARQAIDFHTEDLGALERTRYTLVEVPAEFGAGSGYSELGYILLGPGAFESGGNADWVPGFLAHETAHQWWGKEGLFRDFANEALAEYSTLRFQKSRRGAGSAARMRRSAVEAVASAAAAGRTTALAAIDGWGAGMDPRTYRVHAYEKAMMLLAMVETEIGAESMTRLLRGFLEQARRERVGWSDLRNALVSAGTGAKTVVEQWEQPSLPELSVEHEARQSGRTWTVKGKLIQSGTAKPLRMTVPLVAVCGEQRVATEVKLRRAEAPFTLRVPAKPDRIVIDPDWLVLASRTFAGAPDKKQVFDAAFKVVNNPTEGDPEKLAATIESLRSLLDAGIVSAGEEAVCHTGIGRCLFRLGKLDEAVTELETALMFGAGGPFHRGWVMLRLGNIADLRGQRAEAIEHYEAVTESRRSSQATIERAKRYLERPYRGYREDG